MVKENELNYQNEKHNCIYNTNAENWPEMFGHGNKTEISKLHKHHQMLPPTLYQAFPSNWLIICENMVPSSMHYATK